MRKVSSVLLIVIFVLSFAASPCFSGFAFASSPVTWEDLGEDAIALRDSYFDLWSSYGDGNFNQLFKSSADIPAKWFKILVDGTLALSPVDDLFFTYEEAKPVVQSSTPKGKDFIKKHNITPETPVLSSDDLVDNINYQNTQYNPKTTNTWLMSYRNEKRYQTLLSNGKAFKPCFTLSDDSSGNTAFTELYLLPFFKDKNGEFFYSKKQLHLYFKKWVDTNSDIYLGLDVYDFATDIAHPVEALTAVQVANLKSDSLPVKYSISTLPNFGSHGFSLYAHQSLDYFIDNRASTYNVFSNSEYETLGYFNFFNSSQTEYKNIFRLFYNSSDDNTYYSNIFKNPWGSDYDDGISDIGYYASKSLITFAYNDIDTSKIPSGQIVTVSGDTIYNYTITNPDTGDSSKFGDYITNNYTYITNNYGEVGSGSGVGGNVTVGGDIEVGGSVGVDVNVNVPDININVNGGAGGSSSLPDTDLVENLPEAPSGFIDYTASLFSFLPAQILSLLIAGLAAAIFCRIWGR